MKRIALIACVIAACNQRDASQAKQAPPAPALAPAPAPRPVTAPPDAEVYEVEIEPPVAAPIATAPPDARKPGARDDEAAMEAEAKKYADLLTADDPRGSDTADMGDMRRRPGADLGQQINDVQDSNAQIQVGGGNGRGSRGNGDPRVGNAPIADTPAPAGRVSVSSKQALDDSTLTADAVLAKIQAVYMASIKRCYRELLKQDPTARGKVALALTVNETGRTVNATAQTFDDTLGACIGGAMSAWRFAIPKDRDGEATEASFSLQLQLVPQ